MSCHPEEVQNLATRGTADEGPLHFGLQGRHERDQVNRKAMFVLWRIASGLARNA